MKFKTLEDFYTNYDLLPSFVALDVVKRLNDWLSVEGRTSTDNYIIQQLNYCNFVYDKLNKDN